MITAWENMEAMGLPATQSLWPSQLWIPGACSVKDSVLLLAVAVIVAFAAWVFWHYVGLKGIELLSTLMIVALAVDNTRLRRELKKRRT